MSKIDYCNSLLYSIPDKLLNRIQRIQNYAARVVLRLHKFSHTTPALVTLQWLPVNRRIDFKIALLVYKALNGQAPACIADLLQPYDPPRKLHSADKQLLSQPPCHLKSWYLLITRSETCHKSLIQVLVFLHWPMFYIIIGWTGQWSKYCLSTLGKDRFFITRK